jgi:hypothetical protein
VRTGKARSAIRHHLRTINLPESIGLGKQLLTQALNAIGVAPELPEPLVERLLNESSAKSLEELHADIGIGKRMAALVARHIFGLLGGESASVPVDHNSAADLDPVTIYGSEGVSVQLAPCCLPIPGDQIIGQLRRDQGLQVHTSDCSIAKRQRDKEPDRWIAVKWGSRAEPPLRQPHQAADQQRKRHPGARGGRDRRIGRQHHLRRHGRGQASTSCTSCASRSRWRTACTWRACCATCARSPASTASPANAPDPVLIGDRPQLAN